MLPVVFVSFDGLMKKASFKFPGASIEDIEYYPDRKLGKDLIIQLVTCKYIKDKLNIIVMEATGMFILIKMRL